MDIPEIAKLKTGLEMRKEIIELAIEKNVPEDKVWEELEIYRKETKIISDRSALSVGEVLKNITFHRRKPGEYKILGEYLIGEKLKKRSISYKLHAKVGRYAVNFLLKQHNIIVLVRPVGEDLDRKKLKILMSRGYLVMDFEEVYIYHNLDDCMGKIMAFCGTISAKGEASENS